MIPILGQPVLAVSGKKEEGFIDKIILLVGEGIE